LEYGVILSEQLLIYLDSTIQELRTCFIVLLSDVILPDFHKAVGPIVIILIANSLAELDLAGSATYAGQRPLLRIVDQGGFDNSKDLIPFVAARPGWLTYKGEDASKLKGELWKISENDPRLVLADAIGYQVRLLDQIYGPPRPVGHVWAISATPPADYLEQLAAVAPNLRTENGDAFGRWKATNARRDYFDCEKMALVALDTAARLIPPEYWPRKNLPLFRRLEILEALKRQQKIRG
jgi:hypothetical protein